MLFLVIGKDGTDAEASARRLAVRPQHLEGFAALKEAGHARWAGAMIDPESGAMKGSVCLMEFPDRAGLDAWLEHEPYVTGRVWLQLEVEVMRAAPIFA